MKQVYALVRLPSHEAPSFKVVRGLGCFGKSHTFEEGIYKRRKKRRRDWYIGGES